MRTRPGSSPKVTTVGYHRPKFIYVRFPEVSRVGSQVPAVPLTGSNFHAMFGFGVWPFSPPPPTANNLPSDKNECPQQYRLSVGGVGSRISPVARLQIGVRDTGMLHAASMNITHPVRSVAAWTTLMAA